jgi:hypothetical protein
MAAGLFNTVADQLETLADLLETVAGQLCTVADLYAYRSIKYDTNKK